MTIPIQNLYYMLCYAWDRLEERDTVPVDASSFTQLADLLAKVLIQGLHHLRKRGFDRGYIEQSEDGRTIRGKLNLTQSLKRNLLVKARACCDYDELSYNILPNRILKTTVHHLLHLSQLDRRLHDPLFDILHWWPEVEAIHLTGPTFQRVQLHRNNALYPFLLDICQFIHENLLVSEKTGELLFKDFCRDEVKMRLLFEYFVRNFYKHELSGYRVYRENIRWDCEAMDEHSARVLPIMETDISLENRERKIIIETKYTPKMTLQHYLSLKETLRTNHLYQLFSYLRNIENSNDKSHACEGILLYPSTGKNVHYSYQMRSHSIQIRTLNLNQNWPQIHYDLIQMIE